MGYRTDAERSSGLPRKDQTALEGPADSEAFVDAALKAVFGRYGSVTAGPHFFWTNEIVLMWVKMVLTTVQRNSLTFFI